MNKNPNDWLKGSDGTHPLHAAFANASGKKSSPRWRPEHVGMIRYSSYWGKYSLVLHVDGFRVTELDGFAGVNQHPSRANTRTHSTPPDKHDKFLTVAEFYRQVIDTK